MTNVFLFSDNAVPTGYGRIADEIGIRLHQRGAHVMAASLTYDGLLPPIHNGEILPYWIASLAGHAWQNEVLKIVNVSKPDVIVAVQDMPYLEGILELPIDWSTTKLIMVTPVDGVPINPSWVRAAKQADAFFTISKFGQRAFTEAGVPNVKTVIPGVNQTLFYPRPTAEREAIREKLGVKPGEFLLGTMAMNQGRKAISLMIEAFFAAKKRTPKTMKYLLDMDARSPAGWDIPGLCESYGWNLKSIIFRDDAVRAGILNIGDRFSALDAHAVISHREGYGLPLVEAMACGVLSIAMDYCSGTEIVGDGKGILIPTISYTVPGTWGGAEDQFPNKEALAKAFSDVAVYPEKFVAAREKGTSWALTQSWDLSFDQLWDVVKEL